jgi:hypothetical protein
VQVAARGGRMARDLLHRMDRRASVETLFQQARLIALN